MKLEVPPLEELKDLFKEIDKQNKTKKTLTEQEILKEIDAYRHAKLKA